MADRPQLHQRAFTGSGGPHLRVLVAGWCELGPWWGGWCREPPLWRLYVQDRPGVELELTDGATVALRPGRAWLLPAGLSARNRVRGTPGHHWVHFDATGLRPPPARPFAVALDPVLAGLCAALRTTACDPGADALELRCRASALVHAVMADWWQGLGADLRRALAPAAADPVLAPALERIEAGLAAPLYNPGLARACGLSPSAFVRRFRAATGVPPAQYVLDRRIARAAELLAAGGAIADIAAAVGFADRYHFSRTFARRLGMTPAAYRDGRLA